MDSWRPFCWADILGHHSLKEKKHGEKTAFWSTTFWKVFSTLRYPLFACCATFCPLDWRQNSEIPIVMKTIHFVACFQRVEVVFVLESITPIAPKHTTFYENVFKNHVHPINPVRIDAIAPQKRKTKRSVNLFTTHPTKIAKSSHFNFLTYQDSWNLLAHFVTPLFSHNFSWHPSLTPVLNHPWRFGKVLTRNPTIGTWALLVECVECY